MEANFFDLLSPFQYKLILGIVASFIPSLVSFFIWLKDRSKKIYILVFSICYVFALFSSLIIRAWMLPGGAAYDTKYQSDRIYTITIQEKLDSYFKLCGVFPTSAEGIKLLESRDNLKDCTREFAPIPPKRRLEVKYVSDGKTYSIQSNKSYHIKGLYILGTDTYSAKLFIKTHKD